MECHLQFGGGVSASGPGGSIGGDNGGSWPGHPNSSHTGSSGTGGAGNPSPGTEATSPLYLPMKSIVRKLGPYEDEAERDHIKEYLNDNPLLVLLIHMFLGNNPTSEQEALIRDFLDIHKVMPNAKLDRFVELNDIIQQNPWGLIQECAQQNGMDTQDYLDLYNHTIPQACQDRLDNFGAGYSNQPISDGNVPLANIDYYGVEITTYPDFDNDGNLDTESEIYQAFRENFTDLASGEEDDFQFTCDIPFNSTNTGDINWEFEPLTVQDGTDFISSNPISSILLIEADASGFLPTIATDDGAIMVSGFTNNDWTISTITTPENGSQPFSGNRQWGWIINQNGNLEFFTRAVDVASISTLLNIGASTECQQETYYDIAEATWQNLQQEIANWVNNNGGQATINTSETVRVKKEKIEEVLTDNESIDQILSNCN